MTLDELIQMSERNKSKRRETTTSNEINIHDTEFNESTTSLSVVGPLRSLTRRESSDPKLEKKVTFARLLNKMSSEINHGCDFDVSCYFTKILHEKHLKIKNLNY